MDAGLGSKPEVLDVMLFSFVMDLADNFNAFRTSEVNPVAALKALSCVLVRLWLLPRPGSIASARYTTSLRKCLPKYLKEATVN